jgi:hypothetical protein
MLPLLPDLCTLELPGREAPDMKMERHLGVTAVLRELNLKLRLILAHGLLTDRAGLSKAGTAPRSISRTDGNTPVTDRGASKLAETGFIRHWLVSL